MIAKPSWTTACPDWERRIIAGESLIPFAPLFPDEAKAALDIFRDLKIVDIQGQPTMKEACRPFIFDFVSAIFGSYDPESGRRLVRYFFELIAKKNSKSTTAAGIMVTALVRNWRQSGEYYILAPTKEIADNSFIPARDMIRADDDLSALLYIQENSRKITHRNTGATLKVVAADSETIGGKKPIGILIDELWLFGKRANAETMFRELEGGLAARPEGFVIYLTTQSDEPPAGVFAQKLEEARAIRDGRVIDQEVLPVLYEYPQSMIDSGEYKNPKNFYIPNPNLGASVDQIYLERARERAERDGKQSVISFSAKHQNIQIGVALRIDRWVGADYWEVRGNTELTIEEILERSDVVTIGIDGGGLDDLLGFSLLGRDEKTREWLSWAHAWAHRGVLERRKSEAPRLLDLAQTGDLTIIDNLGDDVEQLVEIVEQVEASGLLAGIGLDPAGVGAIVDALAAKGIDKDRLIGIPQGWKMNGAIKTAERKLAEGSLTHAAQPLMAWAVGNAKVEPKGNAVSITKAAAGTAKIDPLMALFDAIALMATNPMPRRIASPWDDPNFSLMATSA